MQDVNLLVGALEKSVSGAANQLVPLENVFKSSSTSDMINALQIINNNEMKQFSTAAASFAGFEAVLQMLEQENVSNLTKNILFG